MDFKKKDWILTDDSCLQHVRQNGPDEFSLIELKLCLPMILQMYEVYEDTINMQDYFNDMADELLMILGFFGYKSIEEVRNEYGESANQIMAECVFEHYGSFQANRLMAGTREEAEKAIRDFIASERE